MAKAKARDDIVLVCENCGRKNYMTSRDLKKEGKLRLKKFCRWDRSHQPHKETKKK